MSNTQEIIADALVKSPNDSSLKHYGVKGMKWGVRHDRDTSGSSSRSVKSSAASARIAKGTKHSQKTYKKPSSSSTKARSASGKKKLGKILKRYGSVTAKNGKKVAKASADGSKWVGNKVERHIEAVKNDPNHGLSKEQKAIRKQALESHDPATVAKGMQYLTDAELNQKVARLETENRVRKIVPQNNQNGDGNDNMKSAIARGLQKGVSAGVEAGTSKLVDKTIERATGPAAKVVGEYAGEQFKKVVENYKKAKDYSEVAEKVAETAEKAKDQKYALPSKQ